jgi:hypothetical protein
MHFHPPVAPAYFVRSAGPDGAVDEIVRGESDLAARLRRIARFHGAYWEFKVSETLAALVAQRSFIVRDADGEALSKAEIDAVLAATWRPSRPPRRSIRRFKYRNGPVPFTGSGGSYSCYYRSPRAHGFMIAEAIAAVDALDPENDLAPRFVQALARADKHPTAYDDIPRCRDRSWKRQRKTRWR